MTAVEPTTYKKKVGNVITHAHSVSMGLPRSTDDAQSFSLDDDFGSIGVRPDREQQQLYSCVANGGLYNESDIRVLAMVLKGIAYIQVMVSSKVWHALQLTRAASRRADSVLTIAFMQVLFECFCGCCLCFVYCFVCFASVRG